MPDFAPLPKKEIFVDTDSRLIHLNDPKVKTLKHAKALSLHKWHKARKDLEALLIFTSKACGFCFYNDQRHNYGCLECLVKEKCQELDEQVSIFLDGSLKYIEEDLIPFIENFEPTGDR